MLRTAVDGLRARVFETADTEDGLTLARKHRPDLILLDFDTARLAASPTAEDFAVFADDVSATLLLLGPARRRGSAPRGEFVAKPYHYEPLVRKIEQLLARASVLLARSVVRILSRGGTGQRSAAKSASGGQPAPVPVMSNDE